MKKHLSTIVLILLFFIGLSVLLYPTLSDYWNSKTQTKAIVEYKANVAEMSEEEYNRLFSEAEEYNSRLSSIVYPLANYDKIEGYEDALNAGGNGIIGYITIPKIDVEIPIYHGTSNSVLNIAVGHLEGSSLPIGGESTHCVLSAHRGLPSARLFTDLDEMETGDTFRISVLNRELTYEVDQIHIVEPKMLQDLFIVDGKDYCTLLTCTPYGVNTHRLLVRGHRIETQNEEKVIVLADAYRVDSVKITPIIAAPMLFVLLIVLLFKYRKKKTKNEQPKGEM